MPTGEKGNPKLPRFLKMLPVIAALHGKDAFAQGAPEEQQEVATYSEQGEPKISQAEVFERREDIEKYFEMAYQADYPDFAEAVRMAHFGSREEADLYLSEYTGSYYGPKLKDGDKVTDLDGQTHNYCSTSACSLAHVEKLLKDHESDPEDYSTLENRRLLNLYREKLLAGVAAEEHGIKLILDNNQINTEIYRELVEEQVFELKDGQSITVVRSGRVYRRDGNAWYYNGHPQQDNVWGRLDGGEKYFILAGDTFIEVRDRRYQDGQSGYVDNVSGRFYDVKGTLLPEE